MSPRQTPRIAAEVRAVIAGARRLAMVADNAMVNGDLRRARATLRDLCDVTAASTIETAEPKEHDATCTAR